MENAKIAIFDDHEDSRTFLKIILNKEHEVVVEAGSVEEAALKIEELQPGELDVALVDGNFTPGKNDCSEGSQIASMLNAKLGETISIVGISNIPAEVVAVKGAEKNIHKERIDLIRNYIAEL